MPTDPAAPPEGERPKLAAPLGEIVEVTQVQILQIRSSATAGAPVLWESDRSDGSMMFPGDHWNAMLSELSTWRRRATDLGVEPRTVRAYKQAWTESLVKHNVKNEVMAP